MNYLVQLIASDEFISIYIAITIIIAAIFFFRSRRWVRQECSEEERLQTVLTGAGEPVDRLHTLIKLTDARINTKPEFAKVSSDLSQEKRAAESAVLGATGLLLGALASTPSTRHVQEGLRPSRDFLISHMRRSAPRTSKYAENIIYIGLLGTFLGIVAALSIASTAMPTLDKSAEAVTVDHLHLALRTLLVAASAKFWISAVAISCALVLRFQQGSIDKAVKRLALDLSKTIDKELTKPDVVKAWSVDIDTNLDPIAKMLEDISQQMRSSIASWTELMPEFVEAMAQAQRDAIRQVRVQIERTVLEDFSNELNDMLRQADRKALSYFGTADARAAISSVTNIAKYLEESRLSQHALLRTLEKIQASMERQGRL